MGLLFTVPQGVMKPQTDGGHHGAFAVRKFYDLETFLLVECLINYPPLRKREKPCFLKKKTCSEI